MVDNEKSVFHQSQKAVFRYYTEFVYPFFLKEGLVPEGPDSIPRISSEQEILPLVKFSSVDVHEQQKDGTVPLGLRFYCNWDDEHGLGLRVIKDRVVAVGTDDVALSPDDFGWEGFSK